MTEQELAAGCRNGDRGALKMLYDRYAGWMMGISMRYTGNRQDSEDILQDSFIKIFGSLDRFEYRGVGSLGAWLSRIVVNTALGFLRKRHDLSKLDENYMAADIPDEGEQEVTELYDKVSDEIIIRCIGGLPEGLRIVFNLYMFENTPHEEISRQLGITEAASRVRLHRAKGAMAEAIRQEIKTTER